VLRIESDHEGFKLFLGEREVLKHSRKHPCLRLGAADDAVKQRQGSFKLGQRNLTMPRLRDFQVERADSRNVTVRFEGDLRMKVALRTDLPVQALDITFSDVPAGSNRFRLSLIASRGERIFGCGEQFTHLDVKGRKVPLWTQEQGVGRGRDLITLLANLHSGAGGSWHTTYFPMSAWVSSAGYLVYVETDSYSVADFKRKGETRFLAWGVPERIVIALADDFSASTRAMGAIGGKQMRLPDWTYDGAWLGAQGGTAEIERKLELVLASGAKVGAVWAQDWCGKRVTSFGRQLMWNWRYDGQSYPDLPSTIAGLKARGIRFLGYINPFLAIEGDLYKEASAAGYCVKHPDGGDYMMTVTTFPAAMVDLTNPDAFEWIKGVIKREMIDIGMSGWMADFAEYFPVDGVVRSRESGVSLHNRWPRLWAMANREAIEEAGKAGEICFFSRSGWNGSAREGNAFWAGDQLVNWSFDDGLASVIPAALSLAFCGVGNWHSDIGGYTTVAWVKRSGELLMRWTELAAFSGLMRTHEGNRPGANVQPWSDERTRSHFARMTTIFASLKDYHLATAAEFDSRGVPQVRHPAVDYGDDDELLSLKYQYMYGRDLLVAPTLEKGKILKDVYLPDDEWIHLWSTREFRGGWVSIEAPLGYPAVFYRATSEFASSFDAIRKSAPKFM
jgi:alpha-glucosidase